MPTEAEWVKAALGGNNKNCYPWGNSEPSEQCNWLKYKGEFKDLRPDFYHERGPLPVGLFNPNEYGIYDMAGNVWEWCQDWFDNNYFTTDLMINPKGPESGTKKVLKGGSWSFDPVNLRIQNRSFAFPDSGYPYDGFRCVCSAIDLLTKKNNQE